MPLLVNNEPLEDQWIREEADHLRDRLRADLRDLDDLEFGIRLREIARENVIGRMLLRQAMGGASLEDAFHAIAGQVPRPSKQDVSNYYRKYPNLFQAPEMVRAAHIIKNVDEGVSEEAAHTAILAVEAKLKAGAGFAQTADADSDCPGKGGDLGFFARGDMVPEFEQVVFALKPGEISAPFRSPFGFHIAKLLEKRSPGLRPLHEVREDIEQEIWRQTKLLLVEDLIQKLRARADIRKA